MNLIIIDGKLGKDAILQHTPSGIAVLEFSVAVQESYKEKDGSWKKTTEWFNCRWWGKSAESQADWMKKGTPVLIQGKQKTDKWEDKNDGSKKERKYVLCSTVKHFTPFGKTAKPDVNTNNIDMDQSFNSDDVPF